MIVQEVILLIIPTLKNAIPKVVALHDYLLHCQRIWGAGKSFPQHRSEQPRVEDDSWYSIYSGYRVQHSKV